MKSFCAVEGHTYTYTASGGRSKGCVVCGRTRMPWHRESAASLTGAHALAARIAEGELTSEADEDSL